LSFTPERFDISAVRKKIGHITPSSNTVLEPLTGLMNEPLTDRLSHHFTRILVKQITLGSETSSQFTADNFLAAADLLNHCEPDAIVWNGTSGSWLGIENDQAFSRRITQMTGKPASTSTLALLEAFRVCGFERIALAVPYVSDLTGQIARVYGAQGFEVVTEAHLGLTVNLEIGRTSAETMRRLLRDAAGSGRADCIAVVCTNLAATPLVEEMERELDIPIIDSIAVTFWQACRLVGIDPAIEGWGPLLRGGLSRSA